MDARALVGSVALPISYPLLPPSPLDSHSTRNHPFSSSEEGGDEGVKGGRDEEIRPLFVALTRDCALPEMTAFLGGPSRAPSRLTADGYLRSPRARAHARGGTPAAYPFSRG